MNDYIILTDSTIDLPDQIAKELELTVAPLTVTINDKSYKNYLDEREITLSDFYAAMRNKALPVTTAVNIYEFEEIIEPILKSGKDILYIGFSSAMSSTFSDGCIAAEELLHKYPERKVVTVDTLSASCGQGLLLYLAVQEKRKGKSMEEVKSFVEENRLHICHLFTVDDLIHVMRGGRASKGTAIMGTILNIKPILRVTDEGLMQTISKARGRKSAIRSIADTVAQTITDPEMPIFIGHGDCIEDAQILSSLITEKTGAKDIHLFILGPVCASHSGPGLLGAFYHGKNR